jgi:uncharacterized secreted protein with C-terminal beta-propeller domain
MAPTARKKMGLTTWKSSSVFSNQIYFLCQKKKNFFFFLEYLKSRHFCCVVGRRIKKEKEKDKNAPKLLEGDVVSNCSNNTIMINVYAMIMCLIVMACYMSVGEKS